MFERNNIQAIESSRLRAEHCDMSGDLHAARVGREKSAREEANNFISGGVDDDIKAALIYIHTIFIYAHITKRLPIFYFPFDSILSS
jgi:hypothetical protein